MKTPDLKACFRSNENSSFPNFCLFDSLAPFLSVTGGYMLGTYHKNS
jgi:uncharacterized membrane protein